MLIVSMQVQHSIETNKQKEKFLSEQNHQKAFIKTQFNTQRSNNNAKNRHLNSFKTTHTFTHSPRGQFFSRPSEHTLQETFPLHSEKPLTNVDRGATELNALVSISNSQPFTSACITLIHQNLLFSVSAAKKQHRTIFYSLALGNRCLRNLPISLILALAPSVSCIAVNDNVSRSVLLTNFQSSEKKPFCAVPLKKLLL